MGKMARYIRWSLAAILLVLVWQHSHWAIALALTILFVESEFTNYLASLAFNDLFLYSSEFWRARMCPDEAAARLVMAKSLSNIAAKERLKALKAYTDAVDLYAASIKLRPDLPIPAVDKAKESLAIAYEKASRAYENLKAAGGE
jgi:hypothetical protein